MEPPKICLACARRKLSGQPAKPCADCLLLNVDPLARQRANAMRPLSPLHFASFVLAGGVLTKPARSTSRNL